MGNQKVAAIIQARMGSTRFPGKVLKPLAGKPVIWHIVYRLRKCQTVDIIAIATSVKSFDDPLEEFCREQKIPCVRGSEDNVLDRYNQAAEELEADIIVRVTGDAPLVDPEIIDDLVINIKKYGVDYCSISLEPPSIHEGFGVFTTSTLQRLSLIAEHDPVAREHITPYLRSHPELFSHKFIPIKPEHIIQDSHVSVDTQEDLNRLEKIYSRTGARPGDIDSKDVVEILLTGI